MYNCGKLCVLDKLLPKLKEEGIYSQNKMDIAANHLRSLCVRLTCVDIQSDDKNA